jgi:hypothetical protein
MFPEEGLKRLGPNPPAMPVAIADCAPCEEFWAP